MQSIELFTGAGGLALGVHQAGFRHKAVVELDHNACETMRLNSRGMAWNIKEGDVRQFDYSSYSEGIDLLAAGAPCQPFSLGGKHAGEADPRNLFPEVFRAIRELNPRAFLLENVNGLTRKGFQPYFEYIILQLRFPHLTQRYGESWSEHMTRLSEYAAVGEKSVCVPWSYPTACSYDVSWKVIDVADYGVSQCRRRVFIVGFRKDLGVSSLFPAPTHSRDALLYAQYVDGSYWREHGLSPRSTPARFAKRIERLATKSKPMFQRWRTVRDAVGDLPGPVNHDPYPPLDGHVGIPDAKAYKGHTGSPWDWPSKTIKAGDHGNPGGENMLADDNGSVRYFTVRELARIQTFPDDWRFFGSWSESRRQLGNAVPVSVAETLAHHIRSRLESIERSERLVTSDAQLVATD